jgi:IS605 OrfB family transposase
MITYKYKIQNTIDIASELKQYNSVVRFAYNRFQEGLSQSQVEKIVKETMNNIKDLDASIIKCAVSKAKDIKTDNIIFGGKSLFNKLKFHKKVEKSLWSEKRNSTPLLLRGSTSDSKGNRKAILDIINNNQIILKLNKKNHQTIQLPRLNKNHRKQLSKLEQLCSENNACFSLELNSEFVFIIFDENILKENNYEPKTNRYMTFDLNPNYIGFIIADENNVIHKEIIETKGLNQKNISNNKRKHEILEISKYLTEKAKHFRVENVCFEKLNISSKENQKGKWFNRLVNNYWMRNLIINNIKKRCNIIGIKTIEVLPQYSSFIGQINNPDDVDSIASAIELNRRAVLFDKIYVKKELPKQDIIYPKFNIGSLATLWKEMLKDNINNIKSWKELYSCFKKSKTSYRFLFDENKVRVNSFRFCSIKSYINLYTFIG